MPRAREDWPGLVQRRLTGDVSLYQVTDPASAERPKLVRTRVAKREKLTFPAQDTDFICTCGDDAHLAFPKVVDRAHVK